MIKTFTQSFDTNVELYFTFTQTKNKNQTFTKYNIIYGYVEDKLIFKVPLTHWICNYNFSDFKTFHLLIYILYTKMVTRGK